MKMIALPPRWGFFCAKNISKTIIFFKNKYYICHITQNNYIMNYKQIETAIKKQEVYSTSELGYEDFNGQEFDLTLNEDCLGLSLRVMLSQSVEWSVSQEGCKEVGYNDIYDVEEVNVYLHILDIFDEEGSSVKEHFHPQEIQHLENLLENYVKEMQEEDEMPTTKADLL